MKMCLTLYENLNDESTLFLYKCKKYSSHWSILFDCVLVLSTNNIYLLKNSSVNEKSKTLKSLEIKTKLPAQNIKYIRNPSTIVRESLQSIFYQLLLKLYFYIKQAFIVRYVRSGTLIEEVQITRRKVIQKLVLIILPPH